MSDSEKKTDFAEYFGSSSSSFVGLEGSFYSSCLPLTTGDNNNAGLLRIIDKLCTISCTQQMFIN
jgi:hypothetical protein